MLCMILLPSFFIHNDFIEGNERFKLGGEDLEKLKFFKNFKLFTILKLLFFKFLPLLNTLEVLTFWDLIPRDVEVRAS